MTEVSTIGGDASVDLLSFRDDYETLKDEVAAVPEAQLLTINLPIPTAAQTVLSSIADIRTFRGRLAEELPKFDLVKDRERGARKRTCCARTEED